MKFREISVKNYKFLELIDFIFYKAEKWEHMDEKRKKKQKKNGQFNEMIVAMAPFHLNPHSVGVNCVCMVKPFGNVLI